MLTKDIPREDGSGKLVLAIEDDGETISVNSVGETRTVIIGMSRGEARALAYEILRHTLPVSREMRDAISEIVRDQRIMRDNPPGAPISTIHEALRHLDLPSMMDDGICDYD